MMVFRESLETHSHFMQNLDLFLSGFGMARHLGEFFQVIESIDSKINKLLSADLEYAKKQLALLKNTNSTGGEYIRNARDSFCRSISQVEGKQKAIAYYGHAWCLFALGDKVNAMHELELLTKLNPTPKAVAIASEASCYGYVAVVFIGGLLGIVYLTQSTIGGAIVAGIMVLLMFLNPSPPRRHGQVNWWDENHIYVGINSAGKAVAGFLVSMTSGLHSNIENVLVDPAKGYRLRLLSMREDEALTIQLQECAKRVLEQYSSSLNEDVPG